MTPARTVQVTEQLHDYIVASGTGPDDVAEALIAETRAALPDHAGMQVAPEQGALLTLLTRLADVRNAVEIGTFTGYSSLCIARGLADGGRLLCCDVSTEWTAIGRKYWQLAGVDDRIDLRIAPAIETVRQLPPDPVIDLAFIDADKGSYIAYWDELVPRVRPGGAILVDNTLWSGKVVDAETAGSDPNAVAIRAFNDHASADSRVELTIISIGDGLTFAVKR